MGKEDMKKDTKILVCSCVDGNVFICSNGHGQGRHRMGEGSGGNQEFCFGSVKLKVCMLDK